MSDRSDLKALLLITAAALLCYSGTFNVPFVLDDVTSIFANSNVTAFKFSLKSRLPGELSFALNYLLHGWWLPGYHLVNLLLHLANGLLFYLLLKTILLNQRPAKYCSQVAFYPFAAVAALIFVTHPLQTQAVTYLAQRVTLLSALFSLLTLLFYLKARLAATARAAAVYMAISLLSMAAALFSKENAAALPLLIFLLEVTLFKGRARLLQPLICLLPLLLFVSAVFVIPAANRGLWHALTAFTAEQGAAPRLHYLYSQFPVVADYLRLFILPYGQSLDHDPLLRSSLLEPAVLLSLTLLLACAAGGLLLLRNRNLLPVLAGFGVLWFFFSIWVESGAVPLRDLMAEQRLYFPSMGLSVSMVASAAYFLQQRQLKIAAVFLVLILSLLTVSRNRVWQSEIALWEDVTVKSPDKGRGYGALGHTYQRSGLVDKAELAYRRAMELSPSDHIARNNLGALYLQEKRYEEAVKEFSGALRLSARNEVINFNLGLAFAGMGRLSDAEAAFAEAVRLKPDYRQAAENLAKVRNVMGQSH